MDNAQGSASQYLTFRLADNVCGVGILRVREILELPPVTRVPGTAPAVRGVINVRGTIVPVIDLGVRFGVGEMRFGKRTCAVIVDVEAEGQRCSMGILADEVDRVIELAPSEVAEPPPFGTPIDGAYLEGMGKVGTSFVLLLNIDRILSPADLQEALAAEAAAAEPPPESPPSAEAVVAPA